jgi:hypothetical protein
MGLVQGWVTGRSPDRAANPTGLGGGRPEHDSSTRINRPSVRAIYPPVAQSWLLVVHALSPAGARYKPMRTGGAVLAATTGALLLALALGVSPTPGRRGALLSAAVVVV